VVSPPAPSRPRLARAHGGDVGVAGELAGFCRDAVTSLGLMVINHGFAGEGEVFVPVLPFKASIIWGRPVPDASSGEILAGRWSNAVEFGQRQFHAGEPHLNVGNSRLLRRFWWLWGEFAGAVGIFMASAFFEAAVSDLGRCVLVKARPPMATFLVPFDSPVVYKRDGRLVPAAVSERWRKIRRSPGRPSVRVV